MSRNTTTNAFYPSTGENVAEAHQNDTVDAEGNTVRFAVQGNFVNNDPELRSVDTLSPNGTYNSVVKVESEEGPPEVTHFNSNIPTSSDQIFA